MLLHPNQAIRMPCSRVLDQEAMCSAGVANAGQQLTSQAVGGQQHAARNTLRPTWCACPLCKAIVRAFLDHMFQLCTGAGMGFLDALLCQPAHCNTGLCLIE